MNGTMPWWHSKTIWLGFLTSLAALVSASGAIDSETTAQMVDIGMGVLGAATIASRFTTKNTVTTTNPSTTTENQ